MSNYQYTVTMGDFQSVLETDDAGFMQDHLKRESFIGDDTISPVDIHIHGDTFSKAQVIDLMAKVNALQGMIDFKVK